MASPIDHRQQGLQEEGCGHRPQPASARYDLVVIGERLTAAAAAREGAARGRRVAVIASEEDPACSRLNQWGVAHALRQAARGVQESRRSSPLEFPALLHQARELAARLVEVRTLEQLADARIDLYPGPAVFTRPDAVEANGRELVFRRAVLTLPTRSASPEVRGAAEVGLLNDTTLLDLEQLPERLIVLGLGPWECQWAQTFRRLGSEVHLIGAAPRILPEEPAEAAAIVQRHLEAEGIQLVLACQSWEIERTGTQRGVVIEHGGTKEKLFADQILLNPRCDVEWGGLRLEAAGVATTPRGIVVDRWLRTTNRRIFATGDVCGQESLGPELAETLARRCAANALAWRPRRLDCLTVARCVWTDPEVVRVGPPEAELAAEAMTIDTYRALVAETDQAVLERRETGYAAVQVRRATGEFVGVCLVAEEASELIAPLLLLSAYDLPLSALAEIVACHPSRFELLRRLADRHRHGSPPSLRLFLEETWRRWLSVLGRTWRHQQLADPRGVERSGDPEDP